MKRNLLEILAGLAVLVMLVSFHHRLTRLQVQDHDVSKLRELLKQTVASTGSKDDINAMRQQLMQKLDLRLKDLEVRVAEATEGSSEAKRIRAEITAARQETETIKAELSRDLNRTQQLVDAYHSEFSAKESAARAGILRANTAIESLADRVQRDPRALTHQMLAPTVQLNGDDTVGSGTLVFSGLNAKSGQNENYVLTSYHVIRNILADAPNTRRDGIAITIYQGKDGRIETRGDMVSSDEKIDAALVKLRTDQVFEKVARVLPKARATEVKVWDPVFAVGCPLGNDPIPTTGDISSTKNELNGSNYWMINAPTYFGNSGGGVYLANTRELVGVFSKIYTHGKGNPVVVPHMGLCTPISSVHAWLEKESLDYLLIESTPSNLAAPPR